jgi:hypothetical protein
LFAEGVLQVLKVVFVAPVSMHEQLRKAGYAYSEIQVREEIIFKVLELLIQINPYYKHIVVTEKQRQQLITEFSVLPHKLIDHAEFIFEDSQLHTENAAAADIAGK